MDIPTITFILSVVIILSIYAYLALYKMRTKNEKKNVILITCSVCGKKIPENSEECPYCHTIIKGEKNE